VARLVGGRRVKLRGESPWSASSLRDSERPSKGKLTPALDEKQAFEQIITNATNRQATSGTLH
jgi:hypothetical protein